MVSNHNFLKNRPMFTSGLGGEEREAEVRITDGNGSYFINGRTMKWFPSMAIDTPNFQMSDIASFWLGFHSSHNFSTCLYDISGPKICDVWREIERAA